MTNRRNRMSIDEQSDRREAARQRREAKSMERLMDREDRADRMIGELCRDGRPVFYVYPAGGQYREGTRAELVQHLLCNRYA